MSIAELSAAATVLEELTTRVVTVAEQFNADDRDDLAAKLYEVERSLLAATRRLESVTRELR